MSDKPIAEVEDFGHLSLVASLFKNYGLTDKIDRLLPKLSNDQKINHSQAIQCMIYQGHRNSFQSQNVPANQGA
ncbi:MAG: DUF4277 domain-containing protein [Bdellovibrionales bacterium]|nr:DUF4277 domain-containing protein [Bdellovibrionales bacterium]